jgi:hypothetical protein
MKFALISFMTVFAFSAFAQNGLVEGVLNSSLSENEKKVLEDNPCLGGGQRIRSETGLSSRDFKRGSEHIGVTSYGDVAVLKNNNTMVVYACLRGSGVAMGTGSGKLILEESGVNCSSGEILAYDLRGAGEYNFYFRSPRFSEKASLCEQDDFSVSDAARDAGKDIEEQYNDAINSSTSKVSNQ